MGHTCLTPIHLATLLLLFPCAGPVRSQQPAPRLLADIRPGPAGSGPDSMVSLGSTTLFLADDGGIGREPWVTDGSSQGTRFLGEMLPGVQPGGNTDGTVAAATVFYLAGRGNPPAVWISDGNVLRTVGRLPGISPLNLQTLGDRLIFAGGDAATGSEPWVASPLGLTQLRDIDPGSGSYDPWGFTRSGDLVFFGLLRGAGVPHLWMTDGTPAGTQPVPGVPLGVAVRAMGTAGARLFFVLLPPTGLELWVTDGTASGTSRVGPHAAQVGNTFPLNTWADFVLYWGRDSQGVEPWISDGTPNGTRRIIDLAPGAAWSWRAGQFAALGSRFVFLADDGTGTRLFVSNGSAAGTMPLVPMPLGLDPALRLPYASLHELSDDRALVNFYSSAGNYELWETDGTVAGTRRLLTAPFLTQVHANAGRLILGLGGGSGLEPHALEIGALAHRVGHGCGQGSREPLLYATTPRLGTTLSLRARQMGTASSLLAVGTVSSRPSSMFGDCGIALDPASTVAVAAASAPSWVRTLAIPNQPSLNGLLFAAQAVSFNAGNPRGIEMTNGVHLRLGL